MMPICFNVSVYQMDSKQQVVEISSNSSATDTVVSQDDGRNIDTSFVEEAVVENPSSLKDVQAMQALEYTDFSYTSAKDNTGNGFSSTRGFSDVLFNTESSKEIVSEKYCPFVRQEAENVLSITREFPNVPLDTESSMELYPAKDNAKKPTTPFMMTEKVTDC